MNPGTGTTEAERGATAAIVVGLGNPGSEYRRTRHNVGFLAVEALADSLALGRSRRRFRSRLFEGDAGGRHVYLVEPQTYMNLSGPAVRDAFAFLLPGYLGGAAADETATGDGDAAETEPDLSEVLLVVHDDLDLPEGRMRFRGRGSSGGHRGIASIIAALGTERFARLKIGIGHPGVEPGAPEVQDYVLEPLADERFETLQASAEAAAEAIPMWLSSGVAACANRYNANGGVENRASDDPAAAGRPDSEVGAAEEPGAAESGAAPERRTEDIV